MTRKDYVELMKAKLDDWNAQVDELEAKARRAKAENRQEYLEQVTKLKAQRNRMQDKLDEIAKAKDDAWSHVKEGAEAVWEQLKKTAEETRRSLTNV